MSLFRHRRHDEARTLAVEAAARMKPLRRDEENPLAGAGPDVVGNRGANNLNLCLADMEANAAIQFDAARRTPAPRDAK
jgi:hypothetical protein